MECKFSTTSYDKGKKQWKQTNQILNDSNEISILGLFLHQFEFNRE